jgi:hypothetical protein
MPSATDYESTNQPGFVLEISSSEVSMHGIDRAFQAMIYQT